jgi:membrane protease YdiL (CAAX protease family)
MVNASEQKKLNKKALAIFLSLTFGLTISLCLVARLANLTLFDTPLFLSQMTIAVAMFIPAISAVLTQKFIVKKSLKELGLRVGNLSMYGKSYLTICLLFIVNYLFTWLFIQKPDLTLQSFIGQMSGIGGNLSLPMPASQMLLLMSLITFLGAPIFNLIPSLGEEIGWRGFLLPNLEPLGKVKAMLFSGMIWALWHTPMIVILGFMYGRDIWPGVLLYFLLVTGLGIYMGSVWFKTRSTILAAFIHAVFNANAYGVWSLIFVSESKLIIGPAGVVAVSMCLLLAAITIYSFKDNR